jgi:death-on-curing protein
VNPQYLTFDEVVQLHDLLCFFYGGATDILDRGSIESAIAQPRQGFGGEECFPTLYLKAAAYCYFLTLNHGFRDGNKRVGVGAAFHFLRKNGGWPACSQEDLYEAVMRVISHTCSVEELAAVLEGSSKSPAANLAPSENPPPA